MMDSPPVELRGHGELAIKVLHVSDTHNMHWSIEKRFPFPAADILLHTGDFTNNGQAGELASFAKWLCHLSPRFKAIAVIPGNHDWYATTLAVASGELSASDVVAPGFYRNLLNGAVRGGLPANCFVLDHDELVVNGLRIWGSAWVPWNPCRRSDGSSKSPVLFEAWKARGGTETHRFGEIPMGVDILMTHGPAANIMDCTGTPGRGWGYSDALTAHIKRAAPSVHFFGHLHEQRGEWRKDARGGGYTGGIEYKVREGAEPFVTTGPPPKEYPCKLVSCNAMANHPGKDGGAKHIAAPARLVTLLLPREPGRVPAARGDTGDVPFVGEKVLIRSVGHRSFLTPPDGQAVVMRKEESAEHWWDILECPHEPGSVYFVHCNTQKCLDTQGTGPVDIWNGGNPIDQLIVDNVSIDAGNLRWRIIPCDKEPGAVYIVNTRHGQFLDAHERYVQAWNNNGRDVDTVIRENISKHAGNLRWILQAAVRA